MTARLLITLGCAVAVLLGLAPAAVAVAAPRCWDPDLYARPGIERTHQVWCEFADSVAIATAPAHGSVEGVTWDGMLARFRYRPDLDAPDADRVELAVSGPGGTATVPLDLHIVPLSVNSAPTCTPIADAQRSDGTAPVEFVLSAMCFDNEHDSVTLHGAGPGEHLSVPTTITGGHGWTHNAFLRYRTAAVAGAETATYWGVDDLGARSPDAGISLAVGPGINRLPACRPNPAIGSGSPFRIRMRAGMTRNFAIICEDPDGDRITPAVGVPPQQGAFTTFTPVPGHVIHDGSYEVWVDATYVPAPGALGPDPFTVVAAASPSDRSETSMELFPVPAGENSSHGCHVRGGGTTEAETPVLVTLACDDSEGDPLHAEITAPPSHGTVDPPAIAPGRLGTQEIVVRYVPAAGFRGLDTVGIAVGDGSGPRLQLVLSINVTDKPPPPAPPPPPGPGDPAPGQAAPLAPLEQARRALGTSRVRLLRRAGVARIFAATRRARPGRPALAVTCDLACRVDARAPRMARRRVAVAPGRAGVVRMPRRSAGRVRFTLRIRAAGWAARQVSVALRTRRAR